MWVLLDLNLVGGIGLDALQQIKRRRPGTEVVAMASNGTVQSAVRAMKQAHSTAFQNLLACKI